MSENNEHSLISQEECTGELKEITEVTEEVYALPEKESNRSLLWSILSLVLGIISILSCRVWGLAIVLAAASLGLSVFSRYRLGYFDKAGLFGLIISIIGIVFGIFFAVISISGIFNALA